MTTKKKYLYIIVPIVFVIILLAARWVWAITINTNWNVTVGINVCTKVASAGNTCGGSYYPVAAYSGTTIVNPSAGHNYLICCKTMNF